MSETKLTPEQEAARKKAEAGQGAGKAPEAAKKETPAVKQASLADCLAQDRKAREAELARKREEEAVEAEVRKRVLAEMKTKG